MVLFVCLRQENGEGRGRCVKREGGGGLLQLSGRASVRSRNNIPLSIGRKKNVIAAVSTSRGL